MRWQRSVSSIPIGKVCLSILALGAIKLCLLFNWGIPSGEKQGAEILHQEAVQSGLPLADMTQAHAADAEPADKEEQPQKSASEQMEQLRERERKLDRREQDLLQLEKEIETKLAGLKRQQEELKTLLDEADATKNRKLKHLVDVYSNMKAKQAAEVLETLDEEIAVNILSGMRGRTAGEILSYVNARKAASLSAKLTVFQFPGE